MRATLFLLVCLLSIAWVVAIDSESKHFTEMDADNVLETDVATKLSADMVAYLATLHLEKPLGATCSQLVRTENSTGRKLLLPTVQTNFVLTTRPGPWLLPAFSLVDCVCFCASVGVTPFFPQRCRSPSWTKRCWMRCGRN